MTFLEARDVMFSVFKTVWDNLGYTAVWTDVPATPPDSETVWARAVIRHAEGGQGSLAGAYGAQRWERIGTLHIQIFAPIGDGNNAGYSAAQSVVDAYQNFKHDCLWFRSVRLNEVGSDGAFEQFNVLATFIYDDVR